MPPENGAISTSGSLARLAPLERSAALVALAWALLIGVFWHDWTDMARQWWDSSTYNHVLLVPLIVGWLIHQRWHQLVRFAPVVWWPGLVLLTGSLLVWLLGSFSGLNLLRHAGVVAMLPAVAALALGPRLMAALAFPMAYMVFLVPFGDELIPPLQMITAWLTIQLTHLSGIPAAVNGVFIDTPAGLFEVAEACSGVKFLVAMVALGTLVANVCFVRWKRRLIFMALAIIAPIVANGIRAWGTIYLAQSVGAEVAGGFDHIVYGWLFFALVIALVIGTAWRWFDRSVDADLVDEAAIAASPRLDRLAQRTIGAQLALLAVVALCGGTLAWAAGAARLTAPVPKQIFLPDVPGWTRIDYAPTVWWEPRATGADHRLLGRYRDAQGRTVDVFLAVYAAQSEGREAGGFGEGALRPDSDWAWTGPGTSVANAQVDRLLAQGRVGRTAETYYRIGTMLSGSNARLKLANMADRILLRPRPTVLLILSAEESGTAPASTALSAFRQASGPLDQWMDRAASIR
jgi:exosortase A